MFSEVRVPIAYRPVIVNAEVEEFLKLTTEVGVRLPFQGLRVNLLLLEEMQPLGRLGATIIANLKDNLEHNGIESFHNDLPVSVSGLEATESKRGNLIARICMNKALSHERVALSNIISEVTGIRIPESGLGWSVSFGKPAPGNGPYVAAELHDDRPSKLNLGPGVID